MLVKLHKSIEDLTVNQSLLLECFQSVSEVLDHVPVPPVLLVRSHAWNQTAAEHVVKQPEKRLQDREDLEVTLVDLLKRDH